MRALLIGVDCYMPNELPGGEFYPHLRGCVNDVRRVRALLQEKLGLAAGSATMLTASGTGLEPSEADPKTWPTYANIVAALQKLRDEASPGEQVYIHYSGHGGRAATIFSEVKGPGALDEGLVPTDVGTGTYVRDLELAFLLKGMVDKGLFVTVTIDACHSGGMPRGLGAAKRGISIADMTPRPKASAVAGLDEIMAGFDPHAAKRDASAVPGWLQKTTGYVLIAACRASESAYETFLGGEMSGALTHSLCEALQTVRQGLSYKVLGDTLVAEVHSRFALQTPSIEGERDRAVFGTQSIAPVFAVGVLGHDPQQDRVRIAAGQSGALRKGARLVVYPNGTTDFSALDRRVALVEITDLGATESWCAIKTRFRPDAIVPGAQAVVTGNTAAVLQRSVGYVAAEVDAARRQRVSKELALSGGGWLREAPGEDLVDFKVGVGKDGCDEILDGGGTPLPFITPRLSASSPDADKALVKRLVHLAKYRNVKALKNGDAQSRLANKLSIELEGWQDDFDPVDGLASRKPRPFDAPSCPAVPDGAVLFLRVKNLLDPNPVDLNDPSRILNVVLMDLGPRWQIEQMWPQNADFASLQPGKHEVIALRMTVVPGDTSCVDTFKAIGTTGASSFRWMELAKLDEAPMAAIPRAPGTPLEELFRAMTTGAPKSRTAEVLTSATQGWATAQIEVTTFLPPPAPHT